MSTLSLSNLVVMSCWPSQSELHNVYQMYVDQERYFGSSHSVTLFNPQHSKFVTSNTYKPHCTTKVHVKIKIRLTFFDDSFRLVTRPLNLWIVIGDVYSGYMINIFAGIISVCVRCRKLRLMSGEWSRAIMVMVRFWGRARRS